MELLKDCGDWMLKYGEMNEKRCLRAAGLPRIDMYGVDFGWGLPKKFEYVSIDGYAGAISLCMAREFEGGLEIGLSLPKRKMDAFGKVFYDGLKII